MKKEKYPVTPTVRFLRAAGIAFVPQLYPYEDHGGSARAASCLGVDEHCVIKTIVLQDECGNGLVVLMHGDCQVDLRRVAEAAGVRKLVPAAPDRIKKWTGCQPGGIGPFGIPAPLPFFIQQSIAGLPEILINGGKRGFLLQMRGEDTGCLNGMMVDAQLPKHRDQINFI